MTETATISVLQRDPAGPGCLILVVGPSGAGKDTLIGFARAACVDDPDIFFARRVVTRAASAYEDNMYVSPLEFEDSLARGDFLLHWKAHGLSYGLPSSIVADIRAGRAVVANVSRTVIADARRKFANVTVVVVTAPADVLAARLASRARASDGKTEDRLLRSVDSITPDIVIHNVGSAEDHGAEMLKAIRESRNGTR